MAATVAENKLRKIYYDKLVCIHIVLVTMINIKSAKPGNGKLTFQQILKLRRDVEKTPTVTRLVRYIYISHVIFNFIIIHFYPVTNASGAKYRFDS